MSKRTIILLAAAVGGLGTSGCVTDSYDDYGYAGSDWAGPRAPYQGELHGPGVAILDPWLIETAEGRAVVTLGFSEAAHGFVSEDIAHRANIWFRHYADENRDMRISDPEIRTALVTATGQYLR
jgi:hypothetical protein